MTHATVVERVSGSARDVEARYGLKTETLNQWRARGEGPPYSKAGRSVIYLFADVEAYLEANKVTPKNPA